MSILVVQSANIRLSTMDISISAENNVLLLTIGKNYLPSSMTLSFQSNSRQSLTMIKQLSLPKRKINHLWNTIVQKKIQKVNRVDIDNIETIAANKYFQYYYPGLNRRSDFPINSCLNYGYSIVRSSLARSLAMHGFLLSKGLHHHNQLNAFNLVDDLIEPFRPFIDYNAIQVVSNNIILTKEQRKHLLETLFMECRIDNQITTLQNAIDIYVIHFKNYVYGEVDKMVFPEILPLKIKAKVEE